MQFLPDTVELELYCQMDLGQQKQVVAVMKDFQKDLVIEQLVPIQAEPM